MAAPKDLELSVESASRRFAWRFLGYFIGAVGDAFFLLGSGFTHIGDFINRGAEIAGSNGKEMYKLALKIRERRDNRGSGNRNGGPLTRAEKIWFGLVTFFIGAPVRKQHIPILKNFGAPPVDYKSGLHPMGSGPTHDFFFPGILTLLIRGAEWAVKAVGTLLWTIGEVVHALIARPLRSARNYFSNKGDIKKQEEYLRQKEHEFYTRLKKIFREIGQEKIVDRMQNRDADEIYPNRIHALIGASVIKQMGLLLALPGRVVEWIGTGVERINTIINNACLAVSRFGRETFLDYAKNLYETSGSMSGIPKAATTVLMLVAGIIGGVLTYGGMLASFINNLYTGIPAFALLTLGKIAKVPGRLVYGLGQRWVSDPKQRKFFIEKDLNSTDDTSQLDPRLTVALKDKLYRTFIRNASSEQRAFRKAISAIRQRYKLLMSKGANTNEASEAAAELALEAGYGVVVKELMGNYYGYGEGHGEFPLTQQDPIVQALKDAVGDLGKTYDRGVRGQKVVAKDEEINAGNVIAVHKDTGYEVPVDRNSQDLIFYKAKDKTLEIRQPVPSLLGFWLKDEDDNKSSALARHFLRKATPLDAADLAGMGMGDNNEGNTRAGDALPETEPFLGGFRKTVSA